MKKVIALYWFVNTL